MKETTVTNTEVLILGGGISGLSLAYYLKTLGINCQLVEKLNRLGGAIKSRQIGSYSIDLGPQTFLLEPEIKKLLTSLELNDQIIFPAAQVSNRYLGIPRHNPRVKEFPMNLKSALFSNFFSLSDLYHIGKEILGRFPKGKKEDLSLEELFKERFGKKLTECILAAPFVGIWANSITTLSTKAILPKAYRCYQDGTSILKSLVFESNKKKLYKSYKIATLKGGLETLINALATSCQESINLSEEIVSIKYSGSKWTVHTNLSTYISNKLVISTGANDIAKILENIDDQSLLLMELVELKKRLTDIKSSSVGIIQLSIKKDSIKFPLNGFGVLIPPKHSNGFLGAIYSSSIFPHKTAENRDLITCFCGGSINPELSNVLDKRIEAILLEQIREFYDISTPMIKISSSYWPNGIPEYSVFHEQLDNIRIQVEKKNSNLYFNSNLWNGVSIPSRVRNSLELACRVAS